MDFLKRIASKATRSSQGGNHFKQGRGRAMVKNLKMEKNEDGQYFVGEFYIVSSEDIPGAVDDKGRPENANPAGTSVSYPCLIWKHKSAPGNIKGLILALTGDKEDEISEMDFFKGLLNACTSTTITGGIEAPNEKFEDEHGKPWKFSKANPLRGAVIDFETYQSKIKTGPNAGSLMTKPAWTHVPQSSEDIKKGRDFLDKNAPDEA